MDIAERLRKRAASWLSFDWDNDDIFNDAANEIERLQKENELLQKELKKHLTYQDHRHGRIGTHDPICYEYGPRHYECALRKIDMLREALQFYASKNNYEKKKVWTTTFPQYEPDGYKIITPVLSDNGERARAALKEGE